MRTIKTIEELVQFKDEVRAVNKDIYLEIGPHTYGFGAKEGEKRLMNFVQKTMQFMKDYLNKSSSAPKPPNS